MPPPDRRAVSNSTRNGRSPHVTIDLKRKEERKNIYYFALRGYDEPADTQRLFFFIFPGTRDYVTVISTRTGRRTAPLFFEI